MNELQKEIETLKNGMQALTTVIEAYKNSVEVLSIKLEEFQDNNTINVEHLGEFIETHFNRMSPTYVNLSWSDGGFTADFELQFQDMVNHELPRNWGLDIAEAYVNNLSNSKK